MSEPWVATHRRETGLVELVCSHGVGHPARGSAIYQNLARGHEPGTWETHGCDGCCVDLEWELADLEQGLLIANQLILRYQKRLRELEDLDRSTGPSV
jgi:hypothetical protein